ncbi:MAG TPA: bacillithiol biosynthesis cysteine-adding enzyme BshC, partial [Pyrinomonadaceae bacterium]|nr:bacillithiol biosynthesis cysteine-adding enzyme BshC [Pyrinomonadaceae bacterium]
KLCAALEESNRAWGAGEETLRHLALLREPDSVAVVSGQQIGLFTGPLYTIYKALTAVKLAGCLTQRGTKAVPIFWMASEDHDWAEVASAEVIACDGRLASTSMNPEVHREGAPVGTARLDVSSREAVGRLIDVLPETEFSPEVKKLIADAYAEGVDYTTAFARLLTALMKRFGLILLDPLDARLKELAAPIYAEAALRAPELAAAIDARSRELERAGYHAQVFTSEDAFPLFLQSDGTRRALARNSRGKYAAKGANKEYDAQELSAWAVREPTAFSPNVTFRAVAQDYLLPTVAYIGGAAEIAYFAQVNEIYRLLGRPVTPILPRASLTIVERRTGRTMERYELRLEDFFGGLEGVIARVVEEHLGVESARAFDRADEAIAAALDELQNKLRQFDPTLAEALEGGKKKMTHQIGGLRTRFHRAQMARDRAVHRQLERAFTALYPEKTLQERRINITSLLARHGGFAIDWIYEAIDLGTHDHQVVYL